MERQNSKLRETGQLPKSNRYELEMHVAGSFVRRPVSLTRFFLCPPSPRTRVHTNTHTHTLSLSLSLSLLYPVKLKEQRKTGFSNGSSNAVHAAGTSYAANGRAKGLTYKAALASVMGGGVRPRTSGRAVR